LSGMRANRWCPSRAKEWVGAGDEDALPCSWHHQSDEGLLTIYPPEYRAWAADAGGHNIVAARTVSKGNDVSQKSRSGEIGLAIANPPAGAIYSVDPTLRREFQALPFRVVTARPMKVTWLVDGATVGTASSERTLSWPLAIGAHEIEVRDADGRRARTTVVVR
jgi:membrane carboxypeptidase/penicillin-binding protein PbpC